MGEPQAALIEKAYEYLRNISEVIVEKELFNEVTQRYQPHVMMTRLPAIKYDRLNDAVDAIYPVYEKCCRCIGSHSQPLETLNVRPTLDELKSDWRALQEARANFLRTK